MLAVKQLIRQEKRLKFTNNEEMCKIKGDATLCQSEGLQSRMDKPSVSKDKWRKKHTLPPTFF